MTTMFEQDVTCALCGREQRVTELGSTSTFGPMDLDTRPPELQRSTIGMWVQACHGCGFVSAELGTLEPTDRAVVESAAYRAARANSELDPTANRFVCRSLLDEAAGNLVQAGWRRVHAAWICDDREDRLSAQQLRLEALAMFERARAAGKIVMKAVTGGDELLLADLARRSGAFERGLAFCDAGLALEEVEPFVRDLLQFERQLCEARDVACHHVGEIAQDEDDEAPVGTVH